MEQFRRGGWLIALVCVLIGFMVAVQFRTAQDAKGSLSQQRIEEISDRLLQTEHERDELSEELHKRGRDRAHGRQHEARQGGGEPESLRHP